MDINDKIWKILTKTQISEDIKGKWFVKLDNIDNLTRMYEGTGVLFHYDFPGRDGYYFEVSKNKGDKYPQIILNAGENIHIDRQNETKEEMYDNLSRLESVFKEEKLSFAPAFTEKFKETLLSLKKGERLSLNSGFEAVCIRNNDTEVVLKSTYTGDIKNISIENFNKSDTYIIKKDSDKDIQILYGYAYSAKNCFVNIRVRTDNSDGIKKVSAIENSLNNGDVKHINIGDLSLNVQKKDNKYRWYLSNGDLIDRTLAETILGWAKNSFSEIISLQESDNSFYQACDLPDEDILSLNDTAFNDKSDAFIQKAFEMSDKYPVFVGVRGLIEEEDSYEYGVYVFYKDDEGNRSILRGTYNEDKTFITNIKKVSLEDFSKFYEQKYKENISKIKDDYTSILMNMGMAVTPERINALIDRHFEKNKQVGKNPVQMAIDEVAEETKKLLHEYIKNGIINIKEGDIDL